MKASLQVSVMMNQPIKKKELYAMKLEIGSAWNASSL